MPIFTLTPHLQARVALAALLLFGVAVHQVNSDPAPADLTGSVPSDSVTIAQPEGRDADLFRQLVQRMRGGESFYDAMGRSLREGDYPTASVFNWRTPALYVALAVLPGWVSLALMLGLAVALVAGLLMYLARNGSPEGTVLGVLLSTMTVTTLVDGQGYWMTEAWSGLLIGGSLISYLWRRPIPAVLLGVLALFVRELALLYVLVCVALATRGRQHRELQLWLCGALAFAVYYGIHVSAVIDEWTAGDLGHRASWVQCGGLSFWVSTIEINRAFVASPRILLTCGSVLLVAALWAPGLPAHVRWSAPAYSLFFLAVGQPFNDYWGLVAAVAFALSMAWGVDGVKALIAQAKANEAA